MTVPGLRILTKSWKRYAIVALVAACFVVTVKVTHQWRMNDTTLDGDLIIERRALPDTNSNRDQLPAEPNNPGLGKPPGEPGNLSLREMEMRNAKLEAELKYEKLKAEMLSKDLMYANKRFNQSIQEHDMKLKPTEKPAVNPSDSEGLQGRRTATIKRICSENPESRGKVRTVMTTRSGVTYCHIPGVMETFWFRILRFVNRDFVIDPASPFDISKKDALERPFIRLKQQKWFKLSEDVKSSVLRSKVFLVVQNPYMRLWESYINTIVLPVLWHTVGVQIESKRKSNELLVQQGMKKRYCGKGVTFEEFLIYTMDSSAFQYEPYNQLCDPCQLHPSYVVKTETSRGDMEKVLYHFSLEHLVKGPNYANVTVVRYLTDLITDVWPRFLRLKAEHCVTPGEIGMSLWRALKLGGIINESSLSPLLGDTKTVESILEMVTGLYVRARLDVEAQKARQMVKAYKMVSARTKEAIKNKYKMDFQLFEYSENVNDVIRGL